MFFLHCKFNLLIPWKVLYLEEKRKAWSVHSIVQSKLMVHIWTIFHIELPYFKRHKNHNYEIMIKIKEITCLHMMLYFNSKWTNFFWYYTFYILRWSCTDGDRPILFITITWNIYLKAIMETFINDNRKICTRPWNILLIQ